MDYQSVELFLSRRNCNREKEQSRQEQELECVKLEDMPLEDRRKEATKPLFLIRYE